MQSVTIADLMQYTFLSAPTAAPDGGQAVFVAAKPQAKGYRRDLWHVRLDTGKVTRLTRNGKTSFALWEDANTLLIQRKAKQGSDYARLTIADGAVQDAFHISHTVTGMQRLAAGRYAVTAHIDTNYADDVTPEEKAADADYIQLDELPYWDNGEGYISRRRNTLFIYDEAKGALSRVTERLFQVGHVMPCGDWLYYTGQAYDAMMQQKDGLYRYHLKTGKMEEIIAPGVLRVGKLMAAKGTLYFLASACEVYGSGEKDDFYAMDAEGCGYRHVMDNDYTIGLNVTTDVRLGGGAAVAAYGDGLAYLKTIGARVNLHAMDAQGTERQLVAFGGTIDSFCVLGDAILAVAMQNGSLQEVYCFDAEGNAKQLTHFNDKPLKDRYVGKPRYAGFTNADGVEIDGWVIEPINYDPSKSYPGILTMHGGPCVAFGELFMHEMQVLAGMGYFVLYTNPRGSDGKGAAFADLREKYGDIDYADFMAFVDHALALYPQIDANRLGVTGGSYGGYMTNWIIGHTGRFAAAVSQRSFCNPISDFGTSCIGYTFDKESFGADPWSDVQKLWDGAPLKYADKATTPTLFIHSTEDYNCPLSEGQQMFAALKYNGVESRMFLFKGENHELSRSGRPDHRLRRLAEITNWMNIHLNA